MRNRDRGSTKSKRHVIRKTHILRAIRSSLLRLASSRCIHVVSIAPCHMQTAILVEVEAIDIPIVSSHFPLKGLRVVLNALEIYTKAFPRVTRVHEKPLVT